MKILRLITSFREEASQSFQLGNAIIEKLEKKHPDSSVRTKNLVKNEIPHFNGIHFASFITPTENHTSELQEAVKYSNEAIEELKNADIIVIDVPMYNFTIPSSLKAWIDQIVRVGATFKYSENGVEGLIQGKKVYLSIATGGIYSDGPMKKFDLTEQYLRNILGFIGITDITVFRVEGIAIPEVSENALPKAIQTVEQFVF
ncbi:MULTISPECIES: FMN-dependent NADH-azoreductase [Chryseobacterium]|uniref:FMN dependent NADH:quinone oxidoreductase n=1 Tax=Chryseobacterium wanjuense TaxID=356305 RepID=A0A1I0QZK4_9FLAO|nr:MULTISPECIES: NAD(P)H-dependent oxidoreductase [Chryseobacterium]KYH08252.1 FMN-dependent NADH-azoreductase [Chryseobacterium cucumeris]SEW33426.1 FMN-dependent NADH-azoreductase [Chryseobacterium wanjuense]